ncbi:hypothetical protein [Streptomyces sp. NPDC052042]|uniref:hypothetical protein n=1 Tax=Streptomyces sp. NPDC052042 TaxID=3365683 RepID=UPI0037CF2FAD
MSTTVRVLHRLIPIALVLALAGSAAQAVEETPGQVRADAPAAQESKGPQGDNGWW